MTAATVEKPQVQVDPDTRQAWLKKQQAIHGKEVLPDELIDVRRPDGSLETDSQGESLLEAAVGMLGGIKAFEAGGRKFYVQEPTVGKIKKHLLPAAGKIAVQADLLQKKGQLNSDNDYLALLQGFGEFQDLMLDCITFTDGQADPENRSDWLDSLPATDGIEVIDAYVDGINWPLLVSKGRALWGKVRGVAAVPPGAGR